MKKPKTEVATEQEVKLDSKAYEVRRVKTKSGRRGRKKVGPERWVGLIMLLVLMFLSFVLWVMGEMRL